MDPTDYAVDQLVSQHLANNPRTRSLYNSDAMFHASVKLFRTTLVAVAEEMTGAAMIPQWQVELVLRATLDRLLSDEVLRQHDALVEAATKPLHDMLMADRLRTDPAG